MDKKDTDMVIRSLTIDDLAPVFHLGEKIFTLQSFPNLYRVWDEYEVVNFYSNDPESSFVAEINGEIVGFILSYIVNKSPKKYGYLVWMCVDPKYESKGIASKLFDEFKNYMLENDVKMLLVDTEAENKKALRFFMKKGFAQPNEQIYLTLNLGESEEDFDK